MIYLDKIRLRQQNGPQPLSESISATESHVKLSFLPNHHSSGQGRISPLTLVPANVASFDHNFVLGEKLAEAETILAHYKLILGLLH